MPKCDLPGSDPDQFDNSTTRSRPARRRGLWLWFAAGFLIVFVGMALFVPMASLHPSGQFVIQCKLWQYYLFEIQRHLHASGNLGPGTVSSDVVLATALQHVLVSAVGGTIMLGIGWGVCKIKGR